MAKIFDIAFVADPIEKFDPIAETTFFVMAELTKRGWGCYHFELKDLYLQNETPYAIAKKVKVKKVKGKFEYQIIKTEQRKIESFQAAFLRKDPPVDLNFIDHLTLLELVDQKKCLLINHPTWVKHANEKLFTFHFKGLTPRTLVSQNTDLIKNFVKKEKQAVLKPLNLAGGRGVVKVNHDDPSLSSLIDILTEKDTRYIMAQEYLPEALKGDKRILLLDGEVVGSFLRVPHKSDFRGNLHSGAKLKKCKLTPRDKEIVAKIKPTLQKYGLYFVGIDVIGPHVTEINSTSPMGIGEINSIEKRKVESELVDWLESKLG